MLAVSWELMCSGQRSINSCRNIVSGFRKEEIQDWRDSQLERSGLEGFRKEGYRKRGIQEKRDTGKEGFGTEGR